MKRFLSLVLAVLLLCLSIASAAAEGVVILSAPGMNQDSQPVSLDDVRPGDTAEIESAILKFGDFEILDRIKIYGRGNVESGKEADFAVFYIDVTNLAKIPVDFLKDVEVSVWYNDEYQFGGWAGQFDLDRSYSDQIRDDKGEQFEINPLYVGHYAFVCPLPNFAVTSKAPMRMVIRLMGNEITYNARK